MQEQFTINGEDGIDCSGGALALLVGSDYFSFVIQNEENYVCELKRFAFQKTTVDQLDAVLESNPVLNNPFSSIVTAFDFNTNTLLPVELNTGDNTPLLYLNGSGQQDHIIHEVVKEWGLANIYSIPYELLNWILTQFPSSKFWHVQTLQIKNVVQGSDTGIINLEVLDKRFNLTVARKDKLLLAQQYNYSSPADVLFYLLKICETFGLQQEEVQLNISGLIDKNSVLFKTLYDYFLHIDLQAASWKQSDEYPAHYFTLLNQLVSCES